VEAKKLIEDYDILFADISDEELVREVKKKEEPMKNAFLSIRS
jgi:acetolactate synthase small subunit